MKEFVNPEVEIDEVFEDGGTVDVVLRGSIVLEHLATITCKNMRVAELIGTFLDNLILSKEILNIDE